MFVEINFIHPSNERPNIKDVILKRSLCGHEERRVRARLTYLCADDDSSPAPTPHRTTRDTHRTSTILTIAET